MRAINYFSFLIFVSVHSSFLTEFEKKVHIFYYLWYGNPVTDGSWKHWDHEVLPHWLPHVNDAFSNKIGTKHEPPERIHSPFYPSKGPYSSRDPTIIRLHIQEMVQAGADVAILSWWGQAKNAESTDTQGVSTDSIIPEIFKVADEEGKIKIAFHLEPYQGRTAASLRNDIEYIIKNYGSYTSYYRTSDQRSLFYVYDSYHISAQEWATVFKADGSSTIRGTSLDSVVIGLWLEEHHGDELKEGGFDGVYTYFASSGFSYGSSAHNWMHITRFCQFHGMISVLSVGPGYNDSSIRPWNTHNTHSRR